MYYYLKELEDNTLEIEKVFSYSGDIVIPSRICGKIVSSIGDYCFTLRDVKKDYFIASGDEKISQAEIDKLVALGEIKQIEGENTIRVSLPDTVERLGSYSFYQCKKMEEISITDKLKSIGSDAFMNCRKLRTIRVVADAMKPTSIKQILAQRTEKTTVVFEENGEKQCEILYPEYTESYDLIGPAHIFELNIEGEGFRARQCFKNGVIDFSHYDKILLNECANETIETLCEMAYLRIKYPVDLEEKAKQNYITFLSENIENCIENATKNGNLENIRYLIEYMNESRQEKDEYAFEDF